MKHLKNSDLVFSLAVKHVGNNTSARSCLADARKNQMNGDLGTAMNFALRSIAHSVGILHPDYTRAFHASGVSGEVRLVSVMCR